MLRTRLRHFAIVAALAAVTTLPATASATNSWNGYHWARTANPFTVKLGDNLSSQWDSYLQVASSDWSKSAVLDTVVVAGSASNPRNCKATTGMVQVCNATYGYNGWLGVAGISITGGTHITKGYVKLNDSYFNTSTYNSPAWRQMVTCQEVGHTFGLDHQDENFDNANLGTCMDYTSDPGSNQHPNQHDYDELQIIYSHLDSTTTVASALVNAASARSASTLFGRLVASSHNGKVQTFVHDLGHGDLEVAFVIWA